MLASMLIRSVPMRVDNHEISRVTAYGCVYTQPQT